MGKKAIDHTPVVTLTLDARGLIDLKTSTAMADELVDLINTHVKPHVFDISPRHLQRNALDVEVRHEADYRCEHCNGSWTEDSDAYNGGCCSKDYANDPERLAQLAKDAEAVEHGDFYDYDTDTGRSRRVRKDEPNKMGDIADVWLTDGRPAVLVPELLKAIDKVIDGEFCQIWEDPGPSGCSLARLPDRITRDQGPNILAQELREMIADMGLMPEPAL